MSDTIVRRSVRAGRSSELRRRRPAADPDGEPLVFHWWQYEEAGTYAGRVFIESPGDAVTRVDVPTGAGGTQIHVILEVRDENPIASLRDYRRVVLDVEQEFVEIESIQK